MVWQVCFYRLKTYLFTKAHKVYSAVMLYGVPLSDNIVRYSVQYKLFIVLYCVVYMKSVNDTQKKCHKMLTFKSTILIW